MYCIVFSCFSFVCLPFSVACMNSHAPPPNLSNQSDGKAVSNSFSNIITCTDTTTAKQQHTPISTKINNKNKQKNSGCKSEPNLKHKKHREQFIQPKKVGVIHTLNTVNTPSKPLILDISSHSVLEQLHQKIRLKYHKANHFYS